jgi:hypothetical protein
VLVPINKLSEAHVRLDVKSGEARVLIVRARSRRRMRRCDTWTKAEERRAEERDVEGEAV